MFTPEFINDEKGEVILVANHNIESADALSLSVSYNLARIKNGMKHMPAHLFHVRVIYDVRGQNVFPGGLEKIEGALSSVATVEFMR